MIRIADGINGVRHLALGGLAAAGSLLANALGGWDAALEALLWLMAADYLTGMVVAGVFRRSGKSESGALDSRAGFKGLCRKGAMLLLVLVAVRLDALTGEGRYARAAVVFFFAGNEGLSILENLGLMGVPYPAFLRQALEVLKQKGGKGPEDP